MSDTITARVRCTSRVQRGAEQDTVQFAADYLSDDGKAINAEWSRWTPGLTVQMTVRREVPFEPGAAYELTFTKQP